MCILSALDIGIIIANHNSRLWFNIEDLDGFEDRFGVWFFMGDIICGDNEREVMEDGQFLEDLEGGLFGFISDDSFLDMRELV